MQVPSIFRPPTVILSSLHLWPRPLKKFLLGVAVLFCAGIYILLAAGIISLMAILWDLVIFNF
jgi:hypothetical protein